MRCFANLFPSLWKRKNAKQNGPFWKVSLVLIPSFKIGCCPRSGVYTGNEIKHTLQLRFCQNFQHSWELSADQEFVAA